MPGLQQFPNEVLGIPRGWVEKLLVLGGWASPSIAAWKSELGRMFLPPASAYQRRLRDRSESSPVCEAWCHCGFHRRMAYIHTDTAPVISSCTYTVWMIGTSLVEDDANAPLVASSIILLPTYHFWCHVLASSDDTVCHLSPFAAIAVV